MDISRLYVLVPSHGLEDFPVEGSEDEAAGMLNAFSVIWHPKLLAWCQRLPDWHRADEPPIDPAGQLILVPRTAEDWLPTGWVKEARDQGARVVLGCTSREEYLSAIQDELALEGNLDDDCDLDLVADCLALGTTWLMMELLTRRMHHFEAAGEDLFQRNALAAADAIVNGRVTDARSFLQGAFDALTEAREQFHPPESFLFDLCLLTPDQASDDLRDMLDDGGPVNLMMTAADLQTLSEQQADSVNAMREAASKEQICIVGGDRNELPVPLVSVQSWIHELVAGRHLIQEHVGRPTRVWSRRRFGLTSLLPGLLDRLGYHTALHFALDDGIYPEDENGLFRWEGVDGTEIGSLSRLPLAGDSAVSFLRLPERLAETMEYDQVATLTFARWPKLRTPWLDDLRRMSRYSPVLGAFATFDQLQDQGHTGDHFVRHDECEYLSPYLIHFVALRKGDGVSRFARTFQRQARADMALNLNAIGSVLCGQPVSSSDRQSFTDSVLATSPDATSDDMAKSDDEIERFASDVGNSLAKLICNPSGDSAGMLLLNGLPWSRRSTVTLPAKFAPPADSAGVVFSQKDDDITLTTVDLPPTGFVWLPLAESNADTGSPKIPLAEEGLLRNEHLEVVMNSVTGGIARIKEYGRKPNRFSTQLAYRFGTEQTWPVNEEGDTESDFYSRMVCQSMTITRNGSAVGEIVSQGYLMHPGDDQILCGFTQKVRLARGRKVVDIEIELHPETTPDADPWSNYYAMRFAWQDTTAAVTRSVLGTAQGFRGQRIESPHYIEVADSDTRTTILTDGRPFHRRADGRMIDSILSVDGESATQFRFAVVLEDVCPMAAALEFESPVLTVPDCGSPRQASTGWLLRLSHRNVRLLSYEELLDEPESNTVGVPLPTEADFMPILSGQSPNEAAESGAEDSGEPVGSPQSDDVQWPPSGFAVRLHETEGRRCELRIELFREPTFARTRDLTGKTLHTLKVEHGTVLVPIAAWEIVEVELRW